MPGPFIYFDNSTTSFPKPPQVAEAVYHAIREMGAPNRGVYPIAMEASRTVYRAREAVSNLFHVKNASAAAFMSGATEALNTVICGLLTEKDHVITTVAEHNAVLRPLYRLGCPLSFIPCDGEGRLILEGAERLLRPQTKAVIVNHVSNVTGNAADIAFFSKFCKDNGLYFILDAAQSAGNVPVDASLADAVCFTGHKSLFGPQGTGGVILSGGAPVRPLKVGGTGHHSFDREQPWDMPDRFEAGIQNCHGIAGLLAGITFIERETLTKIREKELMLTRRFVSGVSELKNMKLYGDFSQPERGAVAAVLMEGYSSEELSQALAVNYNIATRPGIHCAPLMHEALHTRKSGLTRFSFSYLNTAEEIDCAVKALSELSSGNIL